MTATLRTVIALSLAAPLSAGATAGAHPLTPRPSPVAPAVLTVAVAADTTFTVNSSDDVDDGTCDASHCSLREAIAAANANPGADTIAFDIPGAGPHEIQPASPLPAVSDTVLIDGTTEPDFTGGPVVELNGVNAGPGADGLHVTAGGSTIRGLVIQNFAVGLRLDTRGGNRVQGNVIGADFRALLCNGNASTGVWVDGSDNVIGGTTANTRNVIVCSGADGVRIGGGGGNVVRGNSIGTDATGALQLANGRDGVRIESAAGDTVGGPGALDGNRIRFNGGAGVAILGAASADNLVAGNEISGNGGDGVSLPDAGSGNRISGNSISGNGGLGIDLGPDGVTANDSGDGDAGANGLQNFPVLDVAWPSGGLYIRGTLNSLSGTDYELELFSSAACNASGHGEGEALLDRTSVTTDAGGDVSFAATFAGVFVPGTIITATATDPSGNTSEFSACVPVTDFTLTVTPDSVIVTRGADAKYAVDLAPVGGPFTGNVALSCSGLPGLTTCEFAPGSVVPGADTTRVILTVSTTSGSASAGAAALALFALALAWGTSRPRRRRLAAALTLAAALLGVTVYAGCGGGETTAPPGGGTPAGRYEFTVTAAVGPVTHTGTSVLIVR